MSTQETTTVQVGIDGIVWLGDGARLPDRATQLGGKGARLDALATRGLPVPPGFCLTRDFFDDGELSDEATEALVAAYRKLGSSAVAVRSSAVGEDQTTTSAAGVHETVLGVQDERGLVDAVRTCLASAVSDRSHTYYGGAEVAMAVVVQELVNAEVSGVLFTVDPVRADRLGMIVEACWGAGEGIVQGRVHTDEFRLDPETGEMVDSTVRSKTVQTVVRPGRGPELIPVAESQREVPCLDDWQLGELGRIARMIRDDEGDDVDIEFCCTAEHVWVVQARPVTAVSGTVSAEPMTPYLSHVPDVVRDATMWSRMDIGEIFNGIMTPMGLGFSRYYQDRVHPDCVRSTGISELGEADLHMGHLGGYVYLNISYTAHLLQQALPQRDQSLFTERFRSEQTAGMPYQNPFGEFPGGFPLWRGSAYWIVSTLREMATMHARARSLTNSRHREFDRARQEDLAALSRPELAARLRHALDYFHKTHVGYMPYYFNAAGFYRLLDGLCGAWLNGASAAEVVDGVKSNMSALRTVRTAGDLAELARVAADLPMIREALVTLPGSEVRGALEGTAEGRAFIDRHIEPFMREHGTRGSQEMELSRPRWVDDWTYLMSMLANYLSQPGLLDTVERHVRNRNEPENILGSLPRHRAAFLRTVIKGYSTFSRLREVTRMPMVTAIWMVRRIVVEVAERASATGQLKSPDDIWFLDFGRFERYLAGGLTAEEFFAAEDIAAGRALHQARLDSPEPPLTIIGTWNGHAPDRRRDGDRNVLNGFGTSAGRAEGTARVVTDMHAQAGEFQAGEILVTTFTDASWTPLFAMAAGVVTDTGSMLSHSSIVARELEVPSVVNTGDATSVITTGDVVRIDGGTGLVEIVQRSAEAPE